jgi:hypothetical protein
MRRKLLKSLRSDSNVSGFSYSDGKHDFTDLPIEIRVQLGLIPALRLTSKTESQMIARLQQNVVELRDLLLDRARQGIIVDGPTGDRFTQPALEELRTVLSSFLTPRDED